MRSRGAGSWLAPRAVIIDDIWVLDGTEEFTRLLELGQYIAAFLQGLFRLNIIWSIILAATRAGHMSSYTRHHTSLYQEAGPFGAEYA